MKGLVQQIFDLIKLLNPLIAVESPLQERLKLLSSLTRECESQNLTCYLWSLEDDSLYQLQILEEKLTLNIVSEYQPIADKTRHEHYFEILRFWKTTHLQGILILEGIFPWIANNPDLLTSGWIKSALINLRLYNRNGNKTAILLGANATLSYDIALFIPTLTQQLPTIEEISIYLREVLPFFNPSEIHELAFAVVGLYMADIKYGIREAISEIDEISAQELNTLRLTNLSVEVSRGSRGSRGREEPLNSNFSPPASPAYPNFSAQELTLQLLAYKIKLIRRVYEIEFIQPQSIKVGGLELMQESFKKYKHLMTPLAQAYNLRIPKGVLLIGPPGTGKSYSAKVCSQLLGVPMIIVEWGNFRSYGNQAEYKLKKLLALVDRIDRITFYLDDFDKGFAGDDDLGRRLAGMLLTWMQERTSNVLIIASANNLELLPPELTRCGRFDDIFKVDLPNNGERHEIFKIHLARFDWRFRNGRDGYTQEQWRRLLKETYRCVGAEIQAIVEKAAASTFCQMFPEVTNDYQHSQLPPLEITLASLLEARQNINPLAIREADKVERMRNRASLQGLPSSPIDDSIYSHGNINIFS